MKWVQANKFYRGSGCGSVGKAVTSDVRGPWFKSSHQQTFIADIYLFTVNCNEKTKIKKEAGNGPVLKKNMFYSLAVGNSPVLGLRKNVRKIYSIKFSIFWKSNSREREKSLHKVFPSFGFNFKSPWATTNERTSEEIK